MEDYPDLLYLLNNDSEKNSSETFYKENSGAQTCDNIENLLRQLSHSVSKTVPDSATSSSCTENKNEGLKLQDPPNLEEILEADETSIIPSAHNVSIINAACQKLLKQIEHQLMTLLKKNRKEQDIIQAFLNANWKNLYSENQKKSSIKCAGIPYFKDSHGFLPPPNDDVLRKKSSNKLLPTDYIKNFPTWNSSDAQNLIKAVKKYDTSKPSTIDWMKISVTDLEGKYSPSECRSKWNMHLNQTVNKSKWSSKEMESLKALSEKYNYQDWDKIADELGTNRTGLQCCIQYQVHTFPTEGKWTKEEDEELKKLVEQFKVKDYVPWSKVSWYFENRSRKQCQERYAYHLGNIKKGNFTMEEDFVIAYLASKLKNFGEVAKFLPKRVATQIRSRYEYLVEQSMPQFSEEEDELLIKLMAQYPRNWGKISKNFKNRSRVQCRKRWAYLQKTIQVEGEIDSGSNDNESQDSATEDTSTSAKYTEGDSENMRRKIEFITKPSPIKPRIPDMYSKLLDYHKCCHKFLFGPKPRIPNSEDLKKLTTKMIITMKKLSVPQSGPLSGFDLSLLSNNCEFDEEDLLVLNKLCPNEQKTRDIELSKNFIPPNYMTLLALRTFTLVWSKIKNLCNFYKEVPQPCPSTTQVSSEDRILFSDAKKLFKSRLKTIFAFPLLLSNITPVEKEKPVYKPKVRKAVKPLSKRKRKVHAKLMSAARNKMKLLCEQFEGTQADVGRKPVKSSSSSEASAGCSVNGGENSNKKSRFSTTACEDAAPLKKRRKRNR